MYPGMLGRRNSDLLVLTVTFLKKLSIVEENIVTMRKVNVVSLCSKFIPCSSAALVSITLRFLLNLSFDKECV